MKFNDFRLTLNKCRSNLYFLPDYLILQARCSVSKKREINLKCALKHLVMSHIM